jgi:putative transposase
MPDHVHLLVRLRADLAVADAVRMLKSNSSRWLRDEPNRLRDFAWQRGYGAFSVSASQSAIVWRYIDQQEIHHRRLSLEGEMERLRLRHRSVGIRSATRVGGRGGARAIPGAHAPG